MNNLQFKQQSTKSQDNSPYNLAKNNIDEDFASQNISLITKKSYIPATDYTQNNLEQYEAECKQLVAQLKNAQIKIKIQEQEKENLQDDLLDLQKKLKTSSQTLAQNAQLDSQQQIQNNDELQSQIQQLEQEKNDLYETIQNLNLQLKKELTSSCIDRSEAIKNDYEKRIEKMIKEFENDKQEIQKLQQQNIDGNEAIRELIDLQSVLNEKNDELQITKQKLLSQENYNNQMKNEIQIQKIKMEELKSQSQNQIVLHSQKIKIKDKQHAEYINELKSNNQKQIQNIKNELDFTQSQLERKIEALKSVTNTAQELQSDLSNTQNDLKVINSQMITWKQKAQEVSQMKEYELEQQESFYKNIIQNETEKQAQESLILKNQIEELNKIVENKNKVISSLQLDNKQMQLQNNNLELEKYELDQQIKQLNQKLQNKEREYNLKYNLQVAEAKENIKQIQNSNNLEIKQLQNELNILNQILEQKNQENEQGKQSLILLSRKANEKEQNLQKMSEELDYWKNQADVIDIKYNQSQIQNTKKILQLKNLYQKDVEQKEKDKQILNSIIQSKEKQYQIDQNRSQKFEQEKYYSIYQQQAKIIEQKAQQVEETTNQMRGKSNQINTNGLFPRENSSKEKNPVQINHYMKSNIEPRINNSVYSWQTSSPLISQRK